MRLWQTSGCIVMMVLLDSINDVWMLAAPGSVAMVSVDMTHTLTWRPPQAACNTTLLYSVQFQGEFELTVRNGSWVDAPDCQRVPHTRCDLTLDLGSDSDYNIHVRAQCGPEASAWSQLSRTFNRRDTTLTVPNMTVNAVGKVLQVSFYRLPVAAAAKVTVWKEGNELQATVYTVPAEQTLLQVSELQDGAEYCVRARTVWPHHVLSSSTEDHCVSISGDDAPWKTPTTVTVTVIIMSGLLFVVFWSMVHCHPRHCLAYFHKEQLPHSLQHVQDVQIPMSPEETELCERVRVVPD